MDDKAAAKVIAAIQRLSNRIAKLDETCVEGAAFANEARRAVTDPADATNPKQIASYVEKAVSPTLQHVTQETRDVHHKIKNESWRAISDANALRRSYEEKCRSLGHQESELKVMRQRYQFNAIIGAVAGAITLDLLLWMTVG